MLADMTGLATVQGWQDCTAAELNCSPVPHESMSNLSARPAFSTTLLNMASAVGLRQMLPAHISRQHSKVNMPDAPFAWCVVVAHAGAVAHKELSNAAVFACCVPAAAALFHRECVNWWAVLLLTQTNKQHCSLVATNA